MYPCQFVSDIVHHGRGVGDFVSIPKLATFRSFNVLHTLDRIYQKSQKHIDSDKERPAPTCERGGMKILLEKPLEFHWAIIQRLQEEWRTRPWGGATAGDKYKIHSADMSRGNNARRHNKKMLSGYGDNGMMRSKEQTEQMHI